MDEKKTVAFPLKLGKGKALETRLSPAPSQGKGSGNEVRIREGARVRGR